MSGSVLDSFVFSQLSVSLGLSVRHVGICTVSCCVDSFWGFLSFTSTGVTERTNSSLPWGVWCLRVISRLVVFWTWIHTLLEDPGLRNSTDSLNSKPDGHWGSSSGSKSSPFYWTSVSSAANVHTTIVWNYDILFTCSNVAQFTGIGILNKVHKGCSFSAVSVMETGWNRCVFTFLCTNSSITL